MASQQLSLNLKVYERLREMSLARKVSMRSLIEVGMNLIEEAEKWKAKEEKK